MSVLHVNVGGMYCYDCVRALRQFLGRVEGVETIDVDDGKVKIQYSEEILGRDELLKLVTDTVNKLGYKVIES